MSMWPLIIPPIILVLCLGFLVWFLAKKSTDPAFQYQLRLREGNVSWRLAEWLREVGLKLLERFVQWLKFLSLKMHNRFHEASTVLRRQRAGANGGAEEAEALANPETSLVEDKEGFWDRWHRRHRETLAPTNDALSQAPTSGTSQTGAVDTERVAINNLTSREPQPTRLSRLSGLKKRVNALVTGDGGDGVLLRQKHLTRPKKLLSEEELIDRIAKNPKDATSYEELGDYYMANENLEDAKACYRQVIKLLPLNREVKDKVRKLERLLVQREKHRG